MPPNETARSASLLVQLLASAINLVMNNVPLVHRDLLLLDTMVFVFPWGHKHAE